MVASSPLRYRALPIRSRQQPSFLVAEALRIVRFGRILVIYGDTEFAQHSIGEPLSRVADSSVIVARVRSATLHEM